MKLSVAVLCARVGMSRQNFYKSRRIRQRQGVDELLIRSLVVAERKMQPRLGGLKLHKRLRPELEAAGLKIGRDRFFDVLRSQGLLLEALPRAPRTTHSRHSLPVFSNLIKELEPSGPHQIWVSDITYIRTHEKFVYLSLITDAYSRKIIGFHLGATLEANNPLQALEMALAQTPAGASPTHHSDRGCQYCCHEYVDRLRERGCSISMTEQDHCAENAMAERVNGILKQEYYLKEEFCDMRQAQKAVEEAIDLYNYHRPHRALQLSTPDQVHRAVA